MSKKSKVVEPIHGSLKATEQNETVSKRNAKMKLTMQVLLEVKNEALRDILQNEVANSFTNNQSENEHDENLELMMRLLCNTKTEPLHSILENEILGVMVKKKSANLAVNEQDNHSVKDEKKVPAVKQPKLKKKPVISSESEGEECASLKDSSAAKLPKQQADLLSQEDGMVLPVKQPRPKRKSGITSESECEDAVSFKEVASAKSPKQRKKSSKTLRGEDNIKSTEEKVVSAVSRTRCAEGVKVARFSTSKPCKSRTQSRRSSKASASEDEDRGVRNVQVNPAVPASKRKFVKTSGSEEDEHSRRTLKVDFKFSNVSSLPTAQASSVCEKPRSSIISDSEERSAKSAIISENKTDTDINPKLKLDGISSECKKRSGGSETLEIPMKSLTGECKKVQNLSSKAKSLSHKKNPSVDVQVTMPESEDFIESPKRSKNSDQVKNSTKISSAKKVLTMSQETSANSGVKALLREEYIESSKLTQVEESASISTPFKPLAPTVGTAVDLEDKKSTSAKKISNKLSKLDKAVKSSTEGHKHQYPKESALNTGKDHLLIPESTDSTTSCQKEPSDEHLLKMLDLSDDKKTAELMEASEKSELRVILSRLSDEEIDKLTPRKCGPAEPDKQDTGGAVTTQVKSEDNFKNFKIPKKSLFLKPAVPSTSGSSKSLIAGSSAKSRNVVKRSAKPQKLSKPLESGAPKGRTKVPVVNHSTDPFHPLNMIGSKRVDPINRLNLDMEELDYEPGVNDDDDAMSLYADSTIFRNVEEASVPEDMLVQKQARESDLDSNASSGSVDSRRLSDMEIDSDGENSEVPADAQDEPFMSSELERNDIPSSSSQKEKELGFPVEVYSESNMGHKKRDSFGSGELDNKGKAHFVAKFAADSRGTGKLTGHISCTESIIQSDTAKCSNENEMPFLVSPNHRPETNKVVEPSTPPQMMSKVSHPPVFDNFEPLEFNHRMGPVDIPGVYFESPKRRAPLLPTPQLPLSSVARSPECTPYTAAPFNSAAIPLPRGAAYVCPQSQISPRESGLPASRLSKSPETFSNQASNNNQVSDKVVSRFLETMRENAPINQNQRRICAASTSTEQLSGTLPIQDQSTLTGLYSDDMRQHDKAKNDPVEQSLMPYCFKFLRDGNCTKPCSSLHEWPQLDLDGVKGKKLALQLIDKMLGCFPFWRDRCFASVTETIGNYCDKVFLLEIAEILWQHCCKFLNDKSKVDYNCWKHLAHAMTLCALTPSYAARSILNRCLLHRKKQISGKDYAIIDNMVDAFFNDFILGGTDLWWSLCILSNLNEYEIPVNVMKEILRDASDSRHLIHHAEICDYLLKSPTIVQPRKPEEAEMLHLIHRFLFALQLNESNLPRAKNLADHFQIPLNNECCAKYAKNIIGNRKDGFWTKRFSLTSPLNPCSNNNQPNSLGSNGDVLHQSTPVSQNAQNRINRQDFAPDQSTIVSFSTTTNEGEVSSSTEVVGTSLPVVCGGQSVPPSPMKLTLKIVAGQTGRSVRSVSEQEPVCQIPCGSGSDLEKRKRVVRDEVVHAPKPLKEEAESSTQAPPLVALIKQGKCGKAAKFISTWKGNGKSIIGIPIVIDTLKSLNATERVETFSNLLLAMGAHMSGKADELKAIMISIGLPILEDLLRGGCYSEASTLHDVLWRKMNPPEVKLKFHSLSYLDLITAWVYVKNEKIKEALQIITSNHMYSHHLHWSKTASSGTLELKEYDMKLRDEVVPIILNHCKLLDDHVSDAEKLYRGMLKAKGSYKIDVSQFHDDILRALVKSSRISEALALAVFANDEHQVKPLRPMTNRLLLTCTSSLPDDARRNYTPEIMHLLHQEPYVQALPNSIEGLSSVTVYLQSVWIEFEVSSIINFLLNCPITNFTHQDIPQIALEIKEAQLPSPAPGEFLFPDHLRNVNPSVSAMEERVKKAMPHLLNQHERSFNGVLHLDTQAVRRHVMQRRTSYNTQKDPSQHPRKVPPIAAGRTNSGSHPRLSYGSQQWEHHPSSAHQWFAAPPLHLGPQFGYPYYGDSGTYSDPMSRNQNRNSNHAGDNPHVNPHTQGRSHQRPKRQWY